MRFLRHFGTILLAASMTVACTKTEPKAPAEKGTISSPGPESSSTATRSSEVKDEILSTIRSWKTPEEVWSKLHPSCLEFLDEGEKQANLKLFSDYLLLQKGDNWKLEPCKVESTSLFSYPVEPTHAVTPESQSSPRYLLKIDGSSWDLIVSEPSELARRIDAKSKGLEAEQIALVKKIFLELSPEQRGEIVQTLEAKGKMTAIKVLREMNSEGLIVNKMVADILQEEN